MTQLYINGKLCDIDDEMDIQLEKSFDNDEEHVIEETEYSFEVDLPVTKNNREAFGFVDVFDVANKFNQVFDAVLNVDETNILVGKFLLTEIDSEYFSGNLYVPAKKSLKDVLGDKKMKDIMPHEFYISTWNDIKEINEGIIFNTSTDRHIAFPYILYRLPYNNTGSTLPITTQDLSASGSSFDTENVFPAYNVCSVLRDIFKGEGYNLQGNIFGMEKFTELYQSFNYAYTDYHQGKNTPYYCSFSLDYKTRKNDNISSTLQVVDLFNETPTMRMGTDAFLLSENSVISNEIDDYNMLVKGNGSESRSLIIPKAGWYRIRSTGRMEFPVRQGYWKQKERTGVCGCYNDADKVDLSQNVFEFQIKKTSSPMSMASLYSFNCATPITPTNLSKDSVKKLDFNVLGLEDVVGVKMSFDENRNKYPKNGLTALVKDYSGFDTSEFIAGARFGAQYSYNKFSDNRVPDRRSDEMAFTCLPNPSKTTMVRYTDDGGVEHMYLPLYSTKGLFNNNPNYRLDYGSQTAQILVRDDSYSNFDGYNKFTPNTEASGGTWDTNTNYGRRYYNGQDFSYASSLTDFDGQWDISTCVWLDEGDMISFEMLTPYNDYRDSCGTFETCSWKHRDRDGVTITNVNFNFQIGFVSGDEKYVPTDNNPLPQFNEIRRPTMTNVNQWLGDQKVNDYINNFLTTFNLKLSRINNYTYSIDTMSNENDTYGNIINIDEWANVKDASFLRLDTKNINLGWTISTDEEGYVHGNDQRVVKTKREESGYTGGILIENEGNTSGDEESIKSNWSYTWMKDITFVNGDVAFSGGTREVPVIGGSDLWENNYITIVDKDFATDSTQRLFYLSKDPNTKFYDYFNVQRYVNDTTLPEVKAPIIFAKNYIVYKNNLNVINTFRLDYNNELSTDTDRTITDIFFNIKKGSQYEVDIPVTLPNDIYGKIRANTLVKFNDGLFRVMGIEGHNVNGNGQATLKLITLN